MPTIDDAVLCRLILITDLPDIDFVNPKSWPDGLIGRHMLAVRIRAEGEQQGIAPGQLPRRLVAHWIGCIAEQGAVGVQDLPVEKVLHLAAQAKFDEAGRFAREHVFDYAVQINNAEGAGKFAVHLARLRSVSHKGGEARRKYTEAERTHWRDLAAGVDLAQHGKRRRAELIAQRLKLPIEAVETIRKAI